MGSAAQVDALEPLLAFAKQDPAGTSYAATSVERRSKPASKPEYLCSHELPDVTHHYALRPTTSD